MDIRKNVLLLVQTGGMLHYTLWGKGLSDLGNRFASIEEATLELTNPLWHILECSQKEGEIKQCIIRFAKVKPLHHIAMHHGITVNRLVALNPRIKNPNLIYPGQKIYVGVCKCR